MILVGTPSHLAVVHVTLHAGGQPAASTSAQALVEPRP